jgi:hypothetical protein
VIQKAKEMVALFIHALAHGFLHPFAGNQKKWKSAENSTAIHPIALNRYNSGNTCRFILRSTMVSRCMQTVSTRFCVGLVGPEKQDAKAHDRHVPAMQVPDRVFYPRRSELSGPRLS